jgi:hypothetical protein
MLLFLIFLIGLFTGDFTWAFKVAGAYILALLIVEVLFWMWVFGILGMLFLVLLV